MILWKYDDSSPKLLFAAYMQEQLVIYIGLRDEVGDNQFSSHRWTIDNSKMTYSNFKPTEPNNMLEGCVVMETIHDFKWADVKCNRLLTRKQSFGLCESNPVSSDFFFSLILYIILHI